MKQSKLNVRCHLSRSNFKKTHFKGSLREFDFGLNPTLRQFDTLSLDYHQDKMIQNEIFCDDLFQQAELRSELVKENKVQSHINRDKMSRFFVIKARFARAIFKEMDLVVPLGLGCGDRVVSYELILDMIDLLSDKTPDPENSYNCRHRFSCPDDVFFMISKKHCKNYSDQGQF